MVLLGAGVTTVVLVGGGVLSVPLLQPATVIAASPNTALKATAERKICLFIIESFSVIYILVCKNAKAYLPMRVSYTPPGVSS